MRDFTAVMALITAAGWMVGHMNSQRYVVNKTDEVHYCEAEAVRICSITQDAKR